MELLLIQIGGDQMDTAFIQDVYDKQLESLEEEEKIKIDFNPLQLYFGEDYVVKILLIMVMLIYTQQLLLLHVTLLRIGCSYMTWV